MAEPLPAEITALLERIAGGDAPARDALLSAVYRELEAIARGYLAAGASIEPRELVHELYLRLATGPRAARDRKHFYAVAALAMRQLLTDRARRRRASKRGGGAVRVTLSGLADERGGLDLVAVDQALARLEALSPRKARIVELRCLVGMTVAEVAGAIALSERTVAAEWRFARAWLSRELGRAEAPDG